MEQVFLSDTELYYAHSQNVGNGKILLLDEEVHHITKVMRHSEGDSVYVTSGEGKIWKCLVEGIEKKKILCKVEEEIVYSKEYPNIVFCLPVMKSNDRLEFAIEKLVELGFTEFIIYNSDKGSSKGLRLERLSKIGLAAMKQSIRAFLPKIDLYDSMTQIFQNEGQKVAFDQNADISLEEFVKNINPGINYLFIIGPESGFSDSEYKLIENSEKLKLTNNRLRSETAAVVAGGRISAKPMI